MIKKEKKYYKYELGIYLFLLYLISSCVYLNGDDFMYGTFAHNGIIDNVILYYMTGNGRFWINIVDSIILFFDRYLFVIINPLIVFSFIVLLAKNVQWINEKTENLKNEMKYIRYGFILFISINVLCLRETVFWITGMMNYLLPATLFLLGIYVFQIYKYRNEEIPNIKKMLYIVICFFAGSSVEQYALMFVGYQTLTMLIDLIRKRKIKKIIIFGYIISIIGLIVLIFAPGNFVRVDNQANQMPSFIENAWTLVYQDTLSPVAFPLFFTLSIISSDNYIKKSTNNYYKFLIIVSLLLMLFIRCFPFFEKAILIVISMFIPLITIFKLLILAKSDIKEEVFTLIFIGIGSQVMLLISAIWGFRCMFSLYLIYILLIMIYLSRIEDTKIVEKILIITALSNLCVIIVPIYLLITKVIKVKRNVFNCQIISSIISIVSLIILLIGYGSNVSIYKNNIINTKKSDKIGEIVIEKLPNNIFSWYSIPMNDFHEKYYKIYYKLPNDLEFKYIENEVNE